MGAAPDSKLARGADLLVMDGTTYEGGLSGHLSIRGRGHRRRLRAAERTLFTHVGHRAGRHAELEQCAGRAARRWPTTRCEIEL